jgi:hypothetical protein
MTDAEIQALLQAGMSTNAITHQHHVGQKRVLRIRRALGIAPAGWIKPPSPSKARRVKPASTAPLLVLRPSGQPSFGIASDPLVAEFIRRKGVTRCPAAAVAYTTATISDADAAILAAHQAQPRRTWRAWA